MIHLLAEMKENLEKIEKAFRALSQVADDLANCYICIEHGRTDTSGDGTCITCGRECMLFEDGKMTNSIHEPYDRVMDERFTLAAERDKARREAEYLRRHVFGGDALPLEMSRKSDSVPIGLHNETVLKCLTATAELAELKQLDARRSEAVRGLLDALAMPSGRLVRRAWDEVCMLYGRYGTELSLGAFVAYHEDLHPGAFMEYLLKAADRMHAADPADPRTKPES